MKPKGWATPSKTKDWFEDEWVHQILNKKGETEKRILHF